MYLEINSNYIGNLSIVSGDETPYGELTEEDFNLFEKYNISVLRNAFVSNPLIEICTCYNYFCTEC
jgi:hypothetical protein